MAKKTQKTDKKKGGITIDKGHDRPVYTIEGLREWEREQNKKKGK